MTGGVEVWQDGDECWTNGCHDEWTKVVVMTDVDRAFGYCQDHADMWDRAPANTERAITQEGDSA